MLPELVQQLGHAKCNIGINTVMLVFVKSRYCLPIRNNDLADTQFANIKQLVLVNNKQNVQG